MNKCTLMMPLKNLGNCHFQTPEQEIRNACMCPPKNAPYQFLLLKHVHTAEYIPFGHSGDCSPGGDTFLYCKHNFCK